MNREYAIALLLRTADPLPAEDHPDWEALAQYLEQDPALDAWFAQSTEADTALHLTLGGITAPETKMQARPTTSAMNRRSWMKAAATFTVLSGGAAAWLLRPIGYAHTGMSVSYLNYCEDMCLYATRLLKLDHKGTDLAELQQWMLGQNAPVPGELPQRVISSVAKGCKSVAWGSRSVGLICFMRSNGELVHIFSLPAAALAEFPDAAEMKQPRSYLGREVVGWKTGGVVNILVAAKPGTPTADLLA